MGYRWRLVCHTIGFLDFFISTLAVLFYLWATFYFSINAYTSGVLMIFLAIGAFVFAILKMAGIWASCTLVGVTNSEDEDCRVAYEVTWRWFKTSVFLLLVPVLTFGAVLLVLWGCWACAGFVGGWVILQVVFILLGTLHVNELNAAVKENAPLLASLNP